MSTETRIDLSPEAVKLLRDMAAMPAELPVKAARAMDYQIWCGPAMGAFNGI